VPAATIKVNREQRDGLDEVTCNHPGRTVAQRGGVEAGLVPPTERGPRSDARLTKTMYDIG
jgi:hypothetical protein